MTYEEYLDSISSAQEEETKYCSCIQCTSKYNRELHSAYTPLVVAHATFILPPSIEDDDVPF